MSAAVTGGARPFDSFLFLVRKAALHDSPLLGETLDAVASAGGVPERTSVHMDRGYDSKATRKRLQERGLLAEIYPHKGKPRPRSGGHEAVGRGATNSYHNAHKKLVWCIERQGGSMIAGWPSPMWSSSCGGSSEKSRLAIAGKLDLLADRDLLAEALSLRFNSGVGQGMRRAVG